MTRRYGYGFKLTPVFIEIGINHNFEIFQRKCALFLSIFQACIKKLFNLHKTSDCSNCVFFKPYRAFIGCFLLN